MIGAAIGALAGGFIGARLAAPKVEIHEHYSERRSSGYSVFYDNRKAMERELSLARKAHDKLMAQQEMAVQNTEEIKALLQMNLRIALMTEEEKLEFRRQMAEYEAEQREKELEARVEQIIIDRKTPQKLSKDEDRYENRKYILALIEIAHLRKCMNDYWKWNMEEKYEAYGNEYEGSIRRASREFGLETLDVRVDANRVYASLLRD
jgi:hypothetical protein